jgi:hypothetical protein
VEGLIEERAERRGEERREERRGERFSNPKSLRSFWSAPRNKRNAGTGDEIDC